MGHTVKIILQDDLPGGKAYAGDVINVRAGYARNFLIPTKKAFYATPENLKRFGVNIDMAEKREESQIEEVSEDKKMADILRSYLKHKTVSGIESTRFFVTRSDSYILISSWMDLRLRSAINSKECRQVKW